MRLLPGWLPIATLLTALVSPVLGADDTSPGRATYLRYCGACHGPTAKGDGIAGTFMRTKPTDLTTIAQKNGGAFPFAKIMQYIDGTAEVRAHGDPDMPVWGEVFRDHPTWDVTRRAEARGTLLLVTDYLQSIQQR